MYCVKCGYKTEDKIKFFYDGKHNGSLSVDSAFYSEQVAWDFFRQYDCRYIDDKWTESWE